MSKLNKYIDKNHEDMKKFKNGLVFGEFKLINNSLYDKVISLNNTNYMISQEPDSSVSYIYRVYRISDNNKKLEEIYTTKSYKDLSFAYRSLNGLDYEKAIKKDIFQALFVGR